MDLRRLRSGEWMVGAAGVGLLVSLFLPWYGEDGASRTGWQSLAILDVILALVALAAIAVPIVTAAYRVPAVPLAVESLVALVALIAVVLVLFRVLDLPDGADGRELGLWAALVATLGIFGSGLVAMRDQRMPLSRRPEIEQMPAPRPEGGP
jgi:hypothetical protein